MSRLLCCCLLFLASPAAAQECIPGGGFDLHIRSDLFVDRSFDWSACDTYVDDGVKVTIVDGGSIVGSPRFSGDSSLAMSGGYIQEVNTGNDGYPWGTITGGDTDNLSFSNRDHQSLISGGTHDIVDGHNLLISGGSIGRLIGSTGDVVLSGGSVEYLYRGYLSWRGGTLGHISDESVLFVSGESLSFVDQRLTGTLPDGSQVDQIFNHGSVVIATAEPIPGDGNRDGTVGLDDLNGVRNLFGTTGFSQWDLNFDQRIDLVDLNLVRNNFGTSTSNVPEPSSLLLGMVLLIAASLKTACR